MAHFNPVRRKGDPLDIAERAHTPLYSASEHCLGSLPRSRVRSYAESNLFRYINVIRLEH